MHVTVWKDYIMSNISIDEKMAILRQLREEQARNQSKLQYRSPGRSTDTVAMPTTQKSKTEEKPYYPKSTLKFRLIFSILLVVSVIACDRFDKCIYSYDTEEIDRMIAEEKILTEDMYEQISLRP